MKARLHGSFFVLFLSLHLPAGERSGEEPAGSAGGNRNGLAAVVTIAGRPGRRQKRLFPFRPAPPLLRRFVAYWTLSPFFDFFA